MGDAAFEGRLRREMFRQMDRVSVPGQLGKSDDVRRLDGFGVPFGHSDVEIVKIQGLQGQERHGYPHYSLCRSTRERIATLALCRRLLDASRVECRPLVSGHFPTDTGAPAVQALPASLRKTTPLAPFSRFSHFEQCSATGTTAGWLMRSFRASDPRVLELVCSRWRRGAFGSSCCRCFYSGCSPPARRQQPSRDSG